LHLTLWIRCVKLRNLAQTNLTNAKAAREIIS
jgi:hypothetical protein